MGGPASTISGLCCPVPSGCASGPSIPLPRYVAVTELNGKRQRNALTAAERSLEALGTGDGERATRVAGKAFDLDQLDLFTALPAAVAAAADDLTTSGKVEADTWYALETAVGPGPLQYLIQEMRG